MILSVAYMSPGGDKPGHFVLLAIVSFLANQLLYPGRFLVFGKVFLVGSLVVLVAITAEGISPVFIASRTFDLVDLSCSYFDWLYRSPLYGSPMDQSETHSRLL